MIVHIKMLQPSDEVREQLERGGWRVEKDQFESLTVRHHRVFTEAEARQRLQEAGLLTSGQLRIRFIKEKAARRQLVPG